MHDRYLFLRGDTILGVCEAIGRDFGFNPNLLRVVLAVGIFFAPMAVIIGYVALSVPIAIAQWAFPTRNAVEAVQNDVKAENAIQTAVEEELPLAA